MAYQLLYLFCPTLGFRGFSARRRGKLGFPSKVSSVLLGRGQLGKRKPRPPPPTSHSGKKVLTSPESLGRGPQSRDWSQAMGAGWLPGLPLGRREQPLQCVICRVLVCSELFHQGPDQKEAQSCPWPTPDSKVGKHTGPIGIGALNQIQTDAYTQRCLIIQMHMHYICTIYTHVCIYIEMHNIWMHLHMDVCTWIHIYEYIYRDVCTHGYILRCI